MPVTEQDVIETYRAAVLERVERSSLRQAAKEVGLGPSGLQKFIDGTQPYRNTVRKLDAWYVRRAEREHGAHSPDTVAVAVRILASLAPVDRRDSFVEGLLPQFDALPLDPRWRAEFAGYIAYMRS